MNDTWIHGRVAFITGAGSGLGAATARQLHARGARLALSDMNGAAVRTVAAGLGGEVLALTADVTDRASMQNAIDATVTRFGQIDLAWANAGVASFGPVALADAAAWRHTIEVNLLGVLNTLQLALPHVQRQRGHLAATASLASFVNGPCMSAYAASKAGVEALCNSLRVELAHHGVTVGVMHPSWVGTPMVRNGEQFSAFRRLRAALPPPLRNELSVEDAAALLAHGLAERRDRVYVPGFVRLMRWLRTPLHTRVMERDMRQAMPEMEQAFVADMAAGLPQFTPTSTAPVAAVAATSPTSSAPAATGPV